MKSNISSDLECFRFPMALLGKKAISRCSGLCDGFNAYVAVGAGHAYTRPRHCPRILIILRRELPKTFDFHKVEIPLGCLETALAALG